MSRSWIMRLSIQVELLCVFNMNVTSRRMQGACLTFPNMEYLVLTKNTLHLCVCNIMTCSVLHQAAR